MVDHPADECLLQSWIKNDTRGLCIVHMPPKGGIDVDAIPANLDEPHETAILCRPRVEELHRAERDLLANDQSSAAAATEIGGEDMSLISNWMHRTDWIEIFAGTNRALLVRLTETPYSSKSGLCLGTYEGVELYSCRNDEERLARIVTALDGVFDRCEDTLRHTDVSIRQ
jgi:hypothetical protein